MAHPGRRSHLRDAASRLPHAKESVMSILQTVRRFNRDDEGAVAIEYALVAAGMAAVVYAVFVANNNSIMTLLNTLVANITKAATGT